MKFLTIALACVVASSSAIVTRDLPFIKTLAMPENYKDYQKPYAYMGVSRCEFKNSTRPDINELQKLAGPRWACRSYSDTRFNHCTVKPEVRDLTSLQFVKVTVALCAKYSGFLMIEQGP